MIKYSIILFFISMIPLLNAASLWNKSNAAKRGLYAGKRAFQVGDLITIDVAERVHRLQLRRIQLEAGNPK